MRKLVSEVNGLALLLPDDQAIGRSFTVLGYRMYPICLCC
jgi:hypothetical protein